MTSKHTVLDEQSEIMTRPVEYLSSSLENLVLKP